MTIFKATFENPEKRITIPVKVSAEICDDASEVWAMASRQAKEEMKDRSFVLIRLELIAE